MNPALISKLYIIVFLDIKLRDSISLFSMDNFNEEKLLQLRSNYFTALVLFQADIPSPSECSIGKVVSVHAQWMLEKYGTGLGQIASYAKQSNYSLRWFQVFRHDYISKIWLPLQQPSLLKYHKANVIPDRIKDTQQVCYCGLEKSPGDTKCFYCKHEFMLEVVSSVSIRI